MADLYGIIRLYDDIEGKNPIGESVSTDEEIQEVYEQDIARKSLLVLNSKGIFPFLKSNEGMVIRHVFSGYEGKILVNDFPEEEEAGTKE